MQDINKEAEAAADKLLAAYGARLDEEALRELLAIAWLLGSRRELVNLLKLLGARGS